MHSPPRRHRRTAGAMLGVGALLVGSGIAAVGPTSASASSHREAPLISGAPQYDNTDVYAFVSPDRASTVTLVANWIPFEEPAGGPNFYPFADDAQYDINVDNNGDSKADLVYRWTFDTTFSGGNSFLYNNGPVSSLTDPNLLHRQTYDLKVRRGSTWTTLIDNGKVAPSYVGKASMPNYAQLRNQAILGGPGGLKSFAGQAEDPFFLDLRVFDLLYGGDLSEVGRDTLRGYNVNTIALQVPKSELTAGDPVIGTWSTTQRKGADGVYRQVSRLGNPLVNEVVIPVKDKDKFNASAPSGDGQFLDYVTRPELPKLIEAIYGIKAPKEPRNDLVSVFLTGVDGLNQPKNVVPSEQLRLNTSIAPSKQPNRLGVIGGDKAGYPNGRRLADDVIDISLQVVEGELVGSPNDLGDAVNRNDRRFGTAFPYVGLPFSGSRGERASSGSSSSSKGFTALTGGNAPDGTGGLPLPALPIGLTTAGALLLLGGAVLARPRLRPRPARALSA